MGFSESVSRSVVSNSLQSCGLQSARLLCPWDSPGKITGVGCIPFSRGSSQLRDWTQVSCIIGGFLIIWVTRKPYSESRNSEICSQTDDFKEELRATEYLPNFSGLIYYHSCVPALCQVLCVQSSISSLPKPCCVDNMEQETMIQQLGQGHTINMARTCFFRML